VKYYYDLLDKITLARRHAPTLPLPPPPPKRAKSILNHPLMKKTLITYLLIPSLLLGVFLSSTSAR